jgi:hypothetical protein
MPRFCSNNSCTNAQLVTSGEEIEHRQDSDRKARQVLYLEEIRLLLVSHVEDLYGLSF